MCGDKVDPERILNDITAAGPRIHTLAGGHLLRIGPSSYAVIPDDAPNTVVKIIKPGQHPFGLNVTDEFALINKLSALSGEHFRLPRAIACGLDPDFIQLENIGAAHSRGNTTPDEATLIGRAFGEFSAKLFTQFGLGHNDLCLNNSTRPTTGSDKIGIIDLASVGKSERIEDVFMCPRYEHPNLCLAMAETIEAAGLALDMDYLIKRMSDNDQKWLADCRSPADKSSIDDRLMRSQATIEILEEHANAAIRPKGKKPAPPPQRAPR